MAFGATISDANNADDANGSADGSTTDAATKPSRRSWHRRTQSQQQQQQEQQQEQESRHNNGNNKNKKMPQKEDPLRLTPTVSSDSVYEYYSKELWPALMASLPLLAHRLSQDLQTQLQIWAHNAWDFVLPAWIKEGNGVQHVPDQLTEQVSKALMEVWERAQKESATKSASFHKFMEYLDSDGDGRVKLAELMDKLRPLPNKTITGSITPLTFWTWSSREWPLMDWKIGVFLWRTFGGMLIVLLVLSIIPGRLHSWSGKILRWPILLLTYFLITVELMAYIVIRGFIRIVEFLIATPRHRKLRRKMARATSYRDWYECAAALDISQKRDRWQKHIHDNSSSHRYNWALIRQLIHDMKRAREKQDILMAEAVLQQATRKNVGGIMSEDLFSYTNTGEPKYIVKEFIDEVTNTLLWITDESLHLDEHSTHGEDLQGKQSYERKFEQKVKTEESKLLKAVISWATLSFQGDESSDSKEDSAPSPPHPIRRRVESDHTVGSDLTDVTNNNNSLPRQMPKYHKEQLVAFLMRARAAYGRTALCLSGGATMGCYHFGHLRGLIETDALPQIVSGTSAGSAIGAMLCTRTMDEMKRDLKPEFVVARLKCFARPWSARFRSLWEHGHLLSGEEWLDMIQWFSCGQLTFEEAYRKTGRILCITLASTTKKAPPVLLNYITAPKVTIASAVVASAAVPGVIAPVRLQVKDSDGVVRSAGEETYFDGSIEHDIPINGLAEQLNCQFFVAAQCNPHVVPFFFNPKGGVGSPSRWSGAEQEASWRGGFLLAALEMYLKNDMKAKFRFLHDMEAAVGFTSPMMAQDFVGSITIVPTVILADYFTLFIDPTLAKMTRCFQVGAVAAYQHAAMIRLHYRIADTIDLCLEKLGGLESRHRRHITNGRRASFKHNKQIEATIANMHRNHSWTKCKQFSMPEVISAALNERLQESDSGSMSDGSYRSRTMEPALVG